MPSFPNPLCLGHSPVWIQSPVKDSPSCRFSNSISVFTVLQPSPPCTPFSFNQGIVSVCIHFLIWTVSPTSPPCASHMLYKCAKSVPACSNVAPLNCRNTAVSTDKSTRYAEKITGKNPVLFTQPHSSTRRICLGGCREELCGTQTRKINQSDDPTGPKFLDCFHLNQWRFPGELPPLWTWWVCYSVCSGTRNGASFCESPGFKVLTLTMFVLLGRSLFNSFFPSPQRGKFLKALRTYLQKTSSLPPSCPPVLSLLCS